jgi:agmatine deiminase
LFIAQINGKPFILEGGGIDVNGRGTLITTEECYLQPKIQVRNKGVGKEQFEETLKNISAFQIFSGRQRN